MSAKDVAEMIVFGLEDNDKVQNAVNVGPIPFTTRVGIQIETDTGEQYIVEVRQAE